MPTTIDSTLDFNAFTEGSTVNNTNLTAAGNTNWTVSGATAVANAASAIHGARGATWSSTTTSGRIQYDYGSNNTTRDVVIGFYLIYGRPTSAAQYVAQMLSLTSGGTVQGDCRINNADTVTIRNGTTAVATSTYTLTPGSTYRFEWKLSDPSNSQELRVYAGESATPLFTPLTGSYTGVLTRVPNVGPNTAAAGGSLTIDTIRLANDWMGPFAPVYPWKRKLSGGGLQNLAVHKH